jgi:hypothetical protein
MEKTDADDADFKGYDRLSDRGMYIPSFYPDLRS